MSKFKFTFTNIFLWIGVVTSCLLIENVAFLTNSPTGTLGDTHFYMLLVVALSSYALLYFFEHLFNKTKVDFVLLGVLGILLAGGLLAIWLFKDVNFFPDDPTKLISLNTGEKLRLSFGYGSFIITMYSILFIFTKNHFCLRNMAFLFVIVIGVVYFTIIFSLCKEMDAYKQLFTNYKGDLTPIQSVFWNTNEFSGTLVMGICACMLLNLVKKNVLSYVSMAIFVAELFITGSILSLISAIVGLALYFVLEIFLAIKKHTKRSFIFLTVLIAIGVTIAVLFACAVSNLLGPLSKPFNVIYYSLTNFDYSTFNLRLRTWKFIIEVATSDKIRLFFGCGFDICNTIINSRIASVSPGGVTTIVSAHSGVMQIFLCNGIVGLAVYALFLGYYLYCAIRYMKINKRFALISLTVGVIMLVYSFGESVIFFNCNVQGMLVGVVFYLPLIMKYKHHAHPKVVNAALSNPYRITALENRNVVKVASFILFSLVCVFSTFLFVNDIRADKLFYHIYICALACSGVLWILLPYAIGQWHKDTKLKYFRLRFILNILFIILIAGGVSTLYYVADPNSVNTYFYIIPSILAGVLLVDVIYYSIIRKASIKDYLATFTAIIKSALPGAILAVGGSILLLYFYQGGLEYVPLTYFVEGLFIMLTYFGVNLIFATKETRYNLEYLDNIYLTYIKRGILIERDKEGFYA